MLIRGPQGHASNGLPEVSLGGDVRPVLATFSAGQPEACPDGSSNRCVRLHMLAERHDEACREDAFARMLLLGRPAFSLERTIERSLSYAEVGE